MSRRIGDTIWIVTRLNGEVVEVYSSWAKANSEYGDELYYIITRWIIK